MKTRLLKKWRREAKDCIGVFRQKNGYYRVVFDKSYMGDVNDYSEDEKRIVEKRFQIVYCGIGNLSEAMKRCDNVRRDFILRNARERKFGAVGRVY